MKCNKCGHDNNDANKFCEKCGNSLEMRPTFCPKCGVELSDNAAFCPRCGAQIAQKGEFKTSQKNAPVVHKKSGSKIIQEKGATYYAIAASTCHLVDCVDNVMDSTLTVSTLLNGEYGIDDVALSILCVVGSSGIKSHLIAPLTDEEILKLKRSADCLKDIIKQLEF